MSFAKDVAGFKGRFRKRLRAVAKESVQQTVNRANTPQAQGGRMPVDTGFLRSSINGEIGRMPTGPSEGMGPLSGSGFTASLIRWNPETGEAFFAGWTAKYARFMEYRYGFVRGSTELWDQTVAREAQRARIGGL